MASTAQDISPNPQQPTKLTLSKQSSNSDQSDNDSIQLSALQSIYDDLNDEANSISDADDNPCFMNCLSM